MKFIIDNYKNDTYAVWQYTKDYKEYQPLEIFVTYKQAFDYWRLLEFNKKELLK